jgi:hypothetical protein
MEQFSILARAIADRARVKAQVKDLAEAEAFQRSARVLLQGFD